MQAAWNRSDGNTAWIGLRVESRNKFDRLIRRSRGNELYRNGGHTARTPSSMEIIIVRGTRLNYNEGGRSARRTVTFNESPGDRTDSRRGAEERASTINLDRGTKRISARRNSLAAYNIGPLEIVKQRSEIWSLRLRFLLSQVASSFLSIAPESIPSLKSSIANNVSRETVRYRQNCRVEMRATIRQLRFGHLRTD